MTFFTSPSVKDLAAMKLPVYYDKLDKLEKREIRNEYERRQHGKCYCCKTRLDGEPSFDIVDIKIDRGLFPEGFFDNPVHLHHNHETGMTIGAVHCHCNAYLWEHCGE
jgi:hypothetical protein